MGVVASLAWTAGLRSHYYLLGSKVVGSSTIGMIQDLYRDSENLQIQSLFLS